MALPQLTPPSHPILTCQHGHLHHRHTHVTVSLSSGRGRSHHLLRAVITVTARPLGSLSTCFSHIVDECVKSHTHTHTHTTSMHSHTLHEFSRQSVLLSNMSDMDTHSRAFMNAYARTHNPRNTKRAHSHHVLHATPHTHTNTQTHKHTQPWSLHARMHNPCAKQHKLSQANLTHAHTCAHVSCSRLDACRPSANGVQHGRYGSHDF